MFKISPLIIVVFTVMMSVVSVSAKEYKAPVIVTYKHSVTVSEMVPGDEVVTTVTFKPLMDFSNLEVRIITEGVQLLEPAERTIIADFKKNEAKEVTIRLRLDSPKGRISLNYFAQLPAEDAFGALKICCYGKETETPQP